MGIKLLGDRRPTIGGAVRHPVAGSWGGGPVAVIDTGGHGPTDARKRQAKQLQTVFGSNGLSVAPGGQVSQLQPYRLLTAEQCQEIYVRCPDVRSSIDQVARQVATMDWCVEPTFDPHDPAYESARKECARITRWLQFGANKNGLTWNELAVKWITDLLKWDAGVMELVPMPSDPGRLEELNVIRGADIHPNVDEYGYLVDYWQDAIATRGSVDGVTRFTPERILYLSMFPNTDGPEGLPLMESMIVEVIGLLRGFESIMKFLDIDEIPGGLLVLTGLKGDALDRIKSEYQAKAGRHHEIRIVGGEAREVVDAKWIEFRKQPRELQIIQLARELRHAIWRVWGVKPVDQGETDEMPRATAQVQMDATESHLIGPICELIQGRINSHVIPRVASRRWADRVCFRYLRERELTEEEKRDRAQGLVALVDRGLMTVNEGRSELQLLPVAGGDVPTCRVQGNGVVPLTSTITEHGSMDVEVAAAQASSGTEADAEADADTDADATDDKVASSHPGGELVPMWVGLSAPTGWTDGTYDDVRTLDLELLANHITDASDVLRSRWDHATTHAANLAGEFAETLGEGDDRLFAKIVSDALPTVRHTLVRQLSTELLPVYMRVATDAQARAASWTGEVSTDAATRGCDYLIAAMERFAGSGGPMAAVGAVLLRDAPTASTVRHDVEQRVRAAFERVWNSGLVLRYASTLIGLGHDVLSAELRNSSSGHAMGIRRPIPRHRHQQRAEWWVQWSVSGQPCEHCAAMVARGMVRLSALPTMPGMRCRASCGSVLVYWTQAEIDFARVRYVRSA